MRQDFSHSSQYHSATFMQFCDSSRDIDGIFKTIPHNKSIIPVDVFTFMGEVYVPVSMQNQNCIFHN